MIINLNAIDIENIVKMLTEERSVRQKVNKARKNNKYLLELFAELREISKFTYTQFWYIIYIFAVPLKIYHVTRKHHSKRKQKNSKYAALLAPPLSIF